MTDNTEFEREKLFQKFKEQYDICIDADNYSLILAAWTAGYEIGKKKGRKETK